MTPSPPHPHTLPTPTPSPHPILPTPPRRHVPACSPSLHPRCLESYSTPSSPHVMLRPSFPLPTSKEKPPDSTRPSRAHPPRCPSKAKATTFVLSRASPCRAPCTAVHRSPSRPSPPGGRRMRLARGSCLYHHPLYSRNRGPPYPTLPPSHFLCTCRGLRKFSFVVPTTEVIATE